MNSELIRETYLSFFEERGHLRMPSASLIPASDDPSVLLTTAGMQPFQPFYLGREAPPAPRLTSSQRCFRTPDIEEVGSTTRHLTCFEMLGNFAFGDYFKEEAIGFAWELSLGAFGFEPSQLWVTVFGGDDELGLGPDTEAIELWKAQGVPEERIVPLPRSENFWQAGATGPCGPCSELYVDRGADFGKPGDRPGDDTDRFLEYWNLVFTAYDLHEDGSLDRAAGQEHRHRPRPRADGGDPAGRRVRLRHRSAATRSSISARSSPVGPTAVTTRPRPGRCGSSPITSAARSS